MRKLLALLLLLVCGAPAMGQTVGVMTVTNCGSVSPLTPSPFVAGRNAVLTIDVNGNVCMATGGSAATNITTNTDTNVKGSPGVLTGIVVNTAGVTSNVKIYDDADGTCSSGLVGTYSTLAQTVLNLNIKMSTGICAKTAGGTPADITILWR